MGFLVCSVGLLLLVIVGGLLMWGWLRREHVERSRDQARLRVVEGQLAMLRGLLRIEVAEHLARRRLMAMQSRDPFENRTDHEEYRSS
jgi:hypothetical protein